MKILRVLVLALVAALGLAACSPAPAAGQKLKVVVAFYPLEFLTQRIGGDRVEITNLTQSGADPHDTELTAQQIAQLGEADLVIYQKGFQPEVDKGIEAAGTNRTLDVSSLVEMLQGDHDHEGEEHGDEHGDEHDHGAYDPHTWLYPGNMVKFADGIAAKLGDLAPDSKDEFTKARTALATDLNQLTTDFKSGLTKCERREFITSHSAFAYMAHYFDLTQISIAGLDPNIEPTTARIAQVHALAKKHGVTTIFYETLISPAVAKAIAGDLNLKTDVLDPLEGITKESRGSDYLEIMRTNLTALRSANGCS